MLVLSSGEKERAGRLLKWGLSLDEIALRLLRTHDFCLHVAIRSDVEEVLSDQ